MIALLKLQGYFKNNLKRGLFFLNEKYKGGCALMTIGKDDHGVKDFWVTEEN